MPSLINRSEAPSHLFNIPELDFSGDLFAEPLDGSWFRLGAWTIKTSRDDRGVEDVVERKTVLLARGAFQRVFDKLESIGNVVNRLGKPGGSVVQSGKAKKYEYTPFHRFEFSFTSESGEGLVFSHSTTSGQRLLVNPDLWLFFELEERTPGSGIWWDPQRGGDALLQRIIEQDSLEVVEIRVDYLLKYLKARQMTLLVGHYRHLHFFDPSPSAKAAFEEGDLVLGSREEGAKALLQNWGLCNFIPASKPFLQRRLHLWFEISPPEINLDDPWADEPPFDPYTFTLPTSVGLVAPSRWKHFPPIKGRIFDGEHCDFMKRVYFRQEVLTKYESASGFDVRDDGSVSCHHYWGLGRSTARVGNELLAVAIGDFAEGVPFDEWPHWRQYAVSPPSPETVKSLEQEPTVAEAVNSLVEVLNSLNAAFAGMAASFRLVPPGPLWRGSLDSLAGRQLKWVYPSTAHDDEFLKRVTLASTLIIEGLESAPLRKLLKAVGGNLDMNDENPPRPLGSRNLLQRLTLVAALIGQFQGNPEGFTTLVRQAEGKVKNSGAPDLQAELEKSYRRVRDDFAPLAFLYDLRNYSGLAHAPNKGKAAAAAVQLGLPGENWHRTDYLRVLTLISNSIQRIGWQLDVASHLV